MRKNRCSPRARVTGIVCAAAICAPAFLAGFPSIAPAADSPPAVPHQGATRHAVESAVARVMPSVVRIHAVRVRYQNGREVKYESVGSGTIISKEGHVVTNHHVAGNAGQIVCTLKDREEVKAVLVSTDPLTDIAVLRLQRGEKTGDFPAATFGDSGETRVGDTVLAMGSPFALSQSVTMGIVSNTEITLPKIFWPLHRLVVDGEDVGSIVRWIGHDAPIYGGNSGGPLVNLKGEVVGINEVSMGISGAIPSNLAREVADRLIRSGKVTRSFVGLEVQPLLRESGREAGALVSGTFKGSPAEKAGFLPGDILLSVDGREVTVRFEEEIPVFNKMIMDLPVGREAEAAVLRGGTRRILRMVTEERESARPETLEMRSWGMTARNLSRSGATEMKRDSAAGVLVTTVRPGGPCWQAKPRIVENDVIVEVEGKSVAGIEDLAEMTRALLEDGVERVPVTVAFERKREKRLALVRLEEEIGIRDRGLEARKAWLPVVTQGIDREMAKKIGIPEGSGLRITQVHAGRSAERAGLKVGDVIVGMDGERIRASSPEERDLLSALTGQYKVGTTVTLSVRRGEERFDVPVELEQSLPPPSEMKRYNDSDFEFTVRDVAFLDRAQEGWDPDTRGVLVEAVGEGGWASIARLSVGDLIRSVDGGPVLDVESFVAAIREVTRKRPGSVVFRVERGIHTLFIELRPSWGGTI